MMQSVQGFRRIILLLSFIFAIGVEMKAIELSDSSRISILTCAPGEELYSCFGHSGIRVTDYKQGFDVVFNYGTFDFEQPGFYVNFLKGHMIYMVGVDRYEDFRNDYIIEQRSIYEQELYLDTADRKTVFAFLSNNAKEENRNYRYDFLFDNCATRMRDVFTKNLHGVHFDYSTFTEHKTFRDLINDYSENDPWAQFGMNILIGLPVDRQATPAEMCFLPDYLSRGFAHATINGRPFTGPKTIVLDIPVKPARLTLDQRFSPTVVFGCLLILIMIVTALEYKTRRHFYGLDYVLFFIAGLMGVIFSALGFTEHTTTQWNLNLVWALPTHIILIFFLPFAKDKKWMLNYFLFSAVIATILVLGWKFMPQKFLFSIILIAAIYAIRSWSIYFAPRWKS